MTWKEEPYYGSSVRVCVSPKEVVLDRGVQPYWNFATAGSLTIRGSFEISKAPIGFKLVPRSGKVMVMMLDGGNITIQECGKD